MSKLHLLCELNDENYTLASFSFYENFQDAVQNAIKACKEWNEDCEIHAGKELRITANCGDSFYVTEIKQVWTELGTHLLVWHHGYQGVNFEVRHQGTYEDCKKPVNGRTSTKKKFFLYWMPTSLYPKRIRIVSCKFYHSC